MLRLLLLPLSLLLVAAARAQPDTLAAVPPSGTDAQTAARPPATAPLDTAAMGRFFRAQLRKGNLPGAAIAVVRGGEIVYTASAGRTRGGGALTPDTPVRIGSTSKSFTALAVVQLAEARRLDLDALVTRYLPRLRFGDAYAAPTLRHLLHHTSGLRERDGLARMPEPFGWADADAWASAPFARLSRACAPGACYDYSNLNYILLGLVVEAVSGETYADYVARHIARPLGMANTSADRGAGAAAGAAQGHRFVFLWRRPADEGDFATAAVPAGFVSASARDLGRYLAAHMDTAAMARVGVSAAAAEAMRHPAEGGDGYGMGWRSSRRTDGGMLVQHTGLINTSGSALAYSPETGDGVAVVVPINSLGASSDLATGMFTALRGATPRPARPAEFWWRAAAFAGLLTSAYSATRSGVRWQQAGRPAAVRTDGRALGTLAWDVGVPAALLVGIPHFTDTPLSIMLASQPDLGYALVGGAALSIVGGALKALTPRR